MCGGIVGIKVVYSGAMVVVSCQHETPRTIYTVIRYPKILQWFCTQHYHREDGEASLFLRLSSNGTRCRPLSSAAGTRQQLPHLTRGLSGTTEPGWRNYDIRRMENHSILVVSLIRTTYTKIKHFFVITAHLCYHMVPQILSE